MNICGIDEAGRGPVIGPLVICGVMVDEKDVQKLRDLGVKDSKLLTPRSREIMVAQIEKVAKFTFQIVTPKEIDETLRSENMNLNWLEAVRTAMIINELKPDRAILDCPSNNIAAYKKYLQVYLENKDIELEAHHKAESKFEVVAAASILAKVMRDREVAGIKAAIGKDFGSLPYEEEILVEINNEIKLLKIGDIVKKRIKAKVFSLDTSDNRIKKYKISDFIMHPPKTVYSLELERGKKVKLTKNHPVFTLNSDCNIVTAPIGNLKGDCHIAVAGSIKTRRGLSFLNLTELKNFSTNTHPIYAKGEPVKCELQRKFAKIQKKKINLGYSRTPAYNWLKNSYVPLHLIELLNLKEKDLFDSVLISRKGNKTNLPVMLPITEELMWFLGIYIAEGWCRTHDVNVAFTGDYVLRKLKQFATKHKINISLTKDGAALNSILLVKFIKYLNIGDRAYKKRIPDFVFSCEPAMVAAFLEGLFYGDGYESGGALEIELTSKEAIKQIQWLLLFLNRFSSFRVRNRKNRYIARIFSKDTNSLSADNMPPILGVYLKNLRLKNKLSLKELADSLRLDPSFIMRLERQKSGAIQKKTLRRYYRLFKEKKLEKLINSDLCWLRIKNLKNLGKKELVYDIGVSVKNKRIENFLGGEAGIILHNSGYPADPRTQEFLKNHADKHPEILRHEWSTIKKTKGMKKLTEFEG